MKRNDIRPRLPYERTAKMAKNENPQHEEQQLQGLFRQLKDIQIEPSPYLKTRVLARAKEDRASRSLLLWKLISAGSVCAVLALSVVSYRLYQNQKAAPAAVTQQAYVIQIDFNAADKELVARAEVELPPGVHFVSSNKQISQERKLTLPVQVKSLGRGKLPFVVAADFSGEKEIEVRLLDQNDELIRKQVLKMKFAKEGSSVNF